MPNQNHQEHSLQQGQEVVHQLDEAAIRSGVDAALQNSVANAYGYKPLIDEAQHLANVAHRMIEKGNKRAAAAVYEIIVDHRLNGYDIPETFGERTNTNGMAKASRLLEIYEQDEHLANTLAESSIAGFHGSRSGALISVLNHGLLSADEARRNGIDIVSGERIYSNIGGQEYVSYADWAFPKSIARYTKAKQPVTIESLQDEIKVAQEALTEQDLPGFYKYNLEQSVLDAQNQLQQIQEHPADEATRLMVANFPVVYGIDTRSYSVTWDSPEDIAGSGRQLERIISPTAPGDIRGEFMVWGKKVALEDIKVIGVPSSRVAEVQALVAKYDRNLSVVPLEVLRGEPLPVNIMQNVNERAQAELANTTEAAPKQSRGVAIAKRLLRKAIGV